MTDSTGRHALRPPPVPKDSRPSPLPFRREGPSWKVVFWGIGLLAAMVVPTATVLVQYGKAEEQRSAIRQEVRGMRERQEQLREQVAALKVRTDSTDLGMRELRSRLQKIVHD